MVLPTSSPNLLEAWATQRQVTTLRLLFSFLTISRLLSVSTFKCFLSLQSRHISFAAGLCVGGDEDDASFGLEGDNMPPSMARWCEEQMLALTGNDDVTLTHFLFSLQNDDEIQSYLSMYLGELCAFAHPL